MSPLRSLQILPSFFNSIRIESRIPLINLLLFSVLNIFDISNASSIETFGGISEKFKNSHIDSLKINLSIKVILSNF